MAKLDEGAQAPTFTLPDQDGNPVSLDDFKGAKVLVYFYPADDTPGCTKEACQFNDNLAGFQAAGVPVIGVSPDDAASHQRFRNKYGLRFPLLTDADHAVMDAWGAWGEKTSYGRKSVGVLRSSFLLDDQGRVERAWHNVKADGHAASVLDQSGADQPALGPPGEGLGELGPRVGRGGGPVGDDLAVGAGQGRAVRIEGEGVGGRAVEGVDVEGERGVEGGGGGGPGVGVGAGEEGEAGAEEVERGAGVAVAGGEPGVGEAVVEVLGQGLGAVRLGALLGGAGDAAGRDGAPLGLVAVQQGRAGPAAQDPGELPAEVVGLGDGGVHAHPGARGHALGGVADQEGAALPVALGDLGRERERALGHDPDRQIGQAGGGADEAGQAGVGVVLQPLAPGSQDRPYSQRPPGRWGRTGRRPRGG